MVKKALEKQDYKTALVILKDLALGNTKAQYNLGLMYHYELSVPQNYGKAFELFEKSSIKVVSQIFYMLLGQCTITDFEI